MDTYQLADIVLRYPRDSATGCVGLEMWPASCAAAVLPRRESLHGAPYIDLLPFGEPWAASVVESLVQFKLAGESYPGAFVQGHSMRQSESVAHFQSSSQEILTGADNQTIVTRMLRADVLGGFERDDRFNLEVRPRPVAGADAA